MSDYTPAHYSPRKLKRRNSADSLELKPSPDILAGVAQLPERPFLVGFAAETQQVEENARAKLESKGVDMVVGNRVGKDRGFGDVETSARVVWEGGGRRIGKCSKPELARQLIGLIAERCDIASCLARIVASERA